MELDNKKKVENIYLLGAMGQIILISGITFVLRKLGYTMDYSTAVGMICIALGGCSTALWGIIVNVKYLNRSASKLVYDFFNIRKSYKWYPFILLLIGIDFSYLYFGSSLIIDQWYAPLFIFLKAIVFGGIEEIGWRYTFQPALEKKIGFIGATIATFFAWGIWHYMFFYIDGSIRGIDIIDFSFGLMTSCFLLGMIYKKTSSLWICVFTHCMINTLSQMFSGGNYFIGYVGRAIVILISCIICFRENK